MVDRWARDTQYREHIFIKRGVRIMRRRVAIIDISGSMRGGFSPDRSAHMLSRKSMKTDKFGAAIEHLEFAIQKMPPGTEVFIIAFAEDANIIYQGPVEDAQGIQSSLQSLSPDGGSTNLESALNLALQLVSPNPKKIQTLDIVTDGLSNRGNPIPVAKALQQQCAVYVHMYLIDPTPEGMGLALEIVGDEGEVDPVSSEIELRGKLQHRLEIEEQEIRHMEEILFDQMVDYKIFQKTLELQEERPRISVNYPEVIAEQKWSSVDVFIYVPELQHIVEAYIRKRNKTESEDYGTISTNISQAIPLGCKIKVCLSSENIKINPSEIEIQWYEPLNKLVFRISPNDQKTENRSLHLNVDVLADDLLVSSMQVPLTVDEKARSKSSMANTTAQLYEEVFASYSRDDIDVVKHLKKRYKALGIYMFIDVDDLRSGSLWRRALFERIDKCDLFQLFWSKSSSDSEYVKIEWQHAIRAIEYKGGRFIRPVYWEEPMPSPPKSISHLNFHKLEFVVDAIEK